MAKSGPKQTNKKSWSKILAAIFVPLIFILTLSLIVLTLSGINVFEQAEKLTSRIPGLSDTASSESGEPADEDMDRIQAVLANKEAEIQELQAEASSKQEAITQMEQQILQLEADLEDARAEEEGDEGEKSKEMAMAFQEMDAEQAAPILENMDQVLAVQVLNKVASKERGEILGEMNPETAASMASLLVQE